MQSQKPAEVSRTVILWFILLNAVVIRQGYTGSGQWYFALTITVPLLLFAIAALWRKDSKTSITVDGLVPGRFIIRRTPKRSSDSTGEISKQFNANKSKHHEKAK